MHPLYAFLLTVAVVVGAKTAAWLIQRQTRNAGLVDAIWAWSLGGLALIYAEFGTAPAATRITLALMGGLWGLRLGTHLWRRNWGKPEDWRYARFRREWGAKADFNMFWFFQFQNVFTLALSFAAFMPAAYRTQGPSALAIASAAAIWIAAVVGEGVADAQMAAFRADPANKGRVCDRGLWRYSRHPNYFFECLHWVAYLPLALAPPGALPWAWISLGAPAVMAFLLMKVSGMPLLEKEMMQRKPGYAEYVRTTHALIPWMPRR
jgi:steroid 5-alpha reductase family enzyme